MTSIRHIAVSATEAGVFATAEFEKQVTLWSLPKGQNMNAFATVLDLGGTRLTLIDADGPMTCAGGWPTLPVMSLAGRFLVDEPCSGCPTLRRRSEGGQRGWLQFPKCKADLYNAVPCLEACGAFTAAVTFISSPQAAINGSRGYARPEPATYFSRSSNRCARATDLK